MFTLLKAIAVGAVVSALTFALGGYLGWSKRGAQAALEVAAATAKAESQARIDTDALNTQLASMSAAAFKESENAREANDRYHALVRAGRVRVSIPVTSPVCPRDDPGAPGAPAQERAELDPEAAVTLDRIANDGDDAIRALNEVIDLYNAVRERLNKEPN
jgi:hypothetical protein